MLRKKSSLIIGLLMLAFLVVFGFALLGQDPLSRELDRLVAEQGIEGLNQGPEQSPELVELGQMLFFDKELSGNRDVSCATCHHPTEATGDGLPLSIGIGGIGLGPERQKGEEERFIPRNATEIFNRGAEGWRTMFWDSRVAMSPEGDLITPADDDLPAGLNGVLAAQAMFPVTSRDEMRGFAGDLDQYGQPNELGSIDDKEFQAMWDVLMARLLSHPAYIELFQAAFPDVPVAELGFQHAANAIAAYEADTYAADNSPWLLYLNGDKKALSEEAKRGAILFFGEAGCARCHAGPLLTDQEHHVLAVPQIGPGKGKEAPRDFGRMRETGDKSERYAFRTPTLHNVAATGPWMHDGAYDTLEAAIRHHLNPVASLRNYRPEEHLPAEYQDLFQADELTIAGLIDGLDPLLAHMADLSDDQIAHLVAFMNALTDPACYDLEHLVPDSVPSGLPVPEETVF